MLILQEFDASSVAKVPGSTPSACITAEVSMIANASCTVSMPGTRNEINGVFGGHGSSLKSFPIEALFPENEDAINASLCVGS